MRAGGWGAFLEWRIQDPTEIRLWGSRVGPENLPFQPALQVTQVTQGSTLRNVAEHKATEYWIVKDGDFGRTLHILILGGKALNMYFMVPISVCTYMEFHFENFISPFKNLKTQSDRLWLTAEVGSRLISPVSLRYIANFQALQNSKWPKNWRTDQVNF